VRQGDAYRAGAGADTDAHGDTDARRVCAERAALRLYLGLPVQLHADSDSDAARDVDADADTASGFHPDPDTDQDPDPNANRTLPSWSRRVLRRTP
jgi:hypothetical protein